MSVCEQAAVAIIADIHCKHGHAAAVKATDEFIDGLIAYRRMLTGFEATAERLDYLAHRDAETLAKALARRGGHSFTEEKKRR